MGKPQAIQFDNGKDYLSNKVKGLLDGLNIVFVRSAAYKGKAKAVVERRFRTIQSSYITAMGSYIGRNTSKRAAIEFQTPKRERKSKDALGNPLKTQQKHIKPQKFYWMKRWSFGILIEYLEGGVKQEAKAQWIYGMQQTLKRKAWIIRNLLYAEVHERRF